MKLLNLVIGLFDVILNIVYYTIASPFLIPYTIYKWSKNKRWRKNVKVGDKCFFINLLETRTYGVITKIYDERTVRFETKSLNGSSSGSQEIDGLRIV